MEGIENICINCKESFFTYFDHAQIMYGLKCRKAGAKVCTVTDNLKCFIPDITENIELKNKQNPFKR